VPNDDLFDALNAPEQTPSRGIGVGEEASVKRRMVMNYAKSGRRILLWIALALAAAAPVRAETFPSRPVHLIIPYGPGGIVDFTGRVLAQKLSDVLGQPVVCDNRPGAGGIVGVDAVAHSEPDGYSIVLIDPAVVINPTLQKSLPYDIFTDLVTISRVSSSPEVLVVAPQLGVKTYAELVAYGKANPGKLNYASAGVGTAPHLAAAMWTLGRSDALAGVSQSADRGGVRPAGI
jgi:tripartite-type tricarboxylate transporter receptor subunit TctC